MPTPQDLTAFITVAKPDSVGRFLVCGLGSLGQHCVANLKTFGVLVSAVDLVLPTDWEVDHLPDMLETLLIGDCCNAEILEKAGVKQCRAVLLVTQNERVNLEAALTARVLNPQIRLVVRSDKQNLNQTLGDQLENFAAFEATHLSASAFAMAAFGEPLLGVFHIDRYQFRVVREFIDSRHRWCDKRTLHAIENRNRRILRHIPADIAQLNSEQRQLIENLYSPSAQFYTWLPNTTVRKGDTLVLLLADQAAAPSAPRRTRSARGSPLWTRLGWVGNLRSLHQRLIALWQTSSRQQIRRVAILCGLTIVFLCLLGTGLFWWHYPQLSWVDAFYATATLLLGGYGDLYSDFVLSVPVPGWLRLFSLGLTLAGTAFIGVIYALLTEQLLTLKFEFLARRPPIPTQDHMVVVAIGRVGHRIASLLQDLKQPVVGISRQALEPEILPNLPMVVGEAAAALKTVNLETAKSVIAVSHDEIQNLEIGLLAYRVNPNCRVIIRTYNQRFSDKVVQLFPYVQALCASALSAEAFAGAAFGEHVTGLFRLYNQTVLVTQYTIERGDTLNGFLLADIAYGYGVVPILYQHWQAEHPKLLPVDDHRLHIGDRLFVLSTIRGLRRIEQGRMAPKHWQVRVESVLTPEGLFDGAAEIARISGCDLGMARRFMEHLPNVFPTRLYRHQALRLVRQLNGLRVKAQIISDVY